MNFLICLRYFSILVVLVLLSSCVSLPEYARPQIYIPEEDTATTQKGFSYRKLAFTDFQATSLPVEIQQYSHHLNARSCITIHPSQNSKVNLRRAIFYDHLTYTGSFDYVSFEASFIPSCSWWNDKVPEKLKTYVLQHEQIHFALAELAARKVTLQAKEELGHYVAFGNSNDEVHMKLRAKVKELIQDAINSDLKVHTAFDEDTSGYYVPKVQQSWFSAVEKRLAEGENRLDDLN
jgi:hypothetical protein